jgi:hypothetical protein
MRAEFLLFLIAVLSLCFLATAKFARDDEILLVLTVGSLVLLVVAGLFKRIAVSVSPRIAISALRSMQIIFILMPLGLFSLVLLGQLGNFRITGSLVAGSIVLVTLGSLYIWYRRLVLDSVKDEGGNEEGE